MNTKNFNWEEFINSIPDFSNKNIQTEEEAKQYYQEFISTDTKKAKFHILHFGKRKIFSNTDKKICILFHLGNIDLWQEMKSYLDRLKRPFDLYVNLLAEKYYFQRTVLSSFPDATIIASPNKGTDLGGTFNLFQFLLNNHLVYDYYLKIHTKTKNDWRRVLLETLLPHDNYLNKTFILLDTYQMIGPQKYLNKFEDYKFNEDILYERSLKFQLGLEYGDLYPLVSKENGNDFDPIFYMQYHKDLKEICRNKTDEDKMNFIVSHWNIFGKYEKTRISHPKYLTKPKRNYKFYAGTMFWFTHTMFQYLLNHMDPIDIIYPQLEVGYIDNSKSTQTHSYEYWFGLLASHYNYPRELEGLKYITFILNDVPIILDPKMKFIASTISYFEKNGYFINIQVINCLDEIECQNRIRRWNMFHNFYIVSIQEVHYSDLYVITDWNQLKENLSIFDGNKIVVFLCQHVKKNQDIMNNFVYYFTTNQIYHNQIYQNISNKNYKFERIQSTSYNVNTTLYYCIKEERNGICFYYPSFREAMVSSFITCLQSLIPYFNDPIYLITNNSIHYYVNGTIYYRFQPSSDQKLAEVFNSCRFGFFLGNLEDLQVVFNMVACGLPCAVYETEDPIDDCSDQIFIKVNNDINKSVSKILPYFLVPDNLKKLSEECLNYAKKHFYPEKQEKDFYDFVEKITY
jgi:hypothetical protein